MYISLTFLNRQDAHNNGRKHDENSHNASVNHETNTPNIPSGCIDNAMPSHGRYRRTKSAGGSSRGHTNDVRMMEPRRGHGSIMQSGDPSMRSMHTDGPPRRPLPAHLRGPSTGTGLEGERLGQQSTTPASRCAAWGPSTRFAPLRTTKNLPIREGKTTQDDAKGAGHTQNGSRQISAIPHPFPQAAAMDAVRRRTR